MARGQFSPGAFVVNRKLKRIEAPGPRAKCIAPAPRGEEYSFHVDKFWIVVEVDSQGHLRLETRRGKQRIVHGSDPNIRHAR